MCAATTINEIKSSDPRPYVTFVVKDRPINALLDSGSTISILATGAVELLNSLQITYRKLPSIVKTADGTPNQVLGYVDLDILYLDKSDRIRFFIVPSLKGQAYLGIDFWSKFQIAPHLVSAISSSLSETSSKRHPLSLAQQSQLKEVMSSFPSYSKDGLGRTSVLEHEIDVGKSKPVKQRYYAISPIKQEQLCGEIDRMLKNDIIEESSSSWCSPVVAVAKPNGSVRLCLDLRKVNSLTIKDAYPLPLIDGLLGRLQETKFISKIDLKEAFWQIPLAVPSRPLTAFTIQGRPLYQFKVMPFGACNAPQTMCRLMHKIIPHELHDRIFVYLDDLLIVTATYHEQIELLKIVSKKLYDANLTINLEKSEFILREVKYLGFLVGEDGLRVDPMKIQAIVEYPAPSSLKQTRRLLGMAGWYRRFIPNFAEVTSAITELLKGKGKKFVWTAEAQLAFHTLKSLLSSAPVLTNPDYKRPFFIRCDASTNGVGGVLYQKNDDDVERPISYMSYKLNHAQRNYTVTEQECLAALLCVKKFRPYIEGYRFTLITDHASLKWLMSQKELSGRLARWSLKLQGYDFAIEHQKGTENIVPDALSRVHENFAADLEKEVPVFCSLIDLDSSEFDQDIDYNELRMKIEKHPESYENLKSQNGKVYIHLEPKADSDLSDLSTWKLWIPGSLTSQILQEEHDNPIASHGGLRKTLDRIRRYFYWPGMRSQVKNYIVKCDVCKRTKAPNRILRPTLGTPSIVDRPWQKIYMDLLGPYPRSKKGKTMILIILDQLTKFVILKTLNKGSATDITSFVRDEIFHVYGAPEMVHTDNGVQFIGKEMKNLLSEFGVRHITTAYYSPQANASERVNRSILAAIRAYVKSDHTTWDKNLPEIACALRNSVHSSTSCSPYFALFGRHQINHGKSYELLRELQCENENDVQLLDLSDRLSLIHEKVKSNLKKAYEQYSRPYNLRSRDRTFVVGQKVYYRLHPLSDATRKFSAKFADKFAVGFVKSKIGRVNYVLENEQHKTLGTFHAKDLQL